MLTKPMLVSIVMVCEETAGFISADIPIDGLAIWNREGEIARKNRLRVSSYLGGGKEMRRSVFQILTAAILLAFVTSCAPVAPSPNGTASPVPSVAEVTIAPAPSTAAAIPTPQEQTVVPTPTPAEPTAIPTPAPAEPTVTPAPTAAPLDFSKEPPLDEFSASIAVPDFLTEEQQDLYRRAHCLYQNMFGGETTALDDIRADVDMGRDGPEVIEQDGLRYYPATGRYRNWADFDAVVHGLFTDDFWQRRNRNAMDGPPIYKEIDGRLWMADISRGNSGYNGNFPDEFRLESQSGDSILFTLIGHYSDEQPREGETFEERDARLEQEYEYTLEFPIRLVLTENGWRFDEFYSAPVDMWRYDTYLFDEFYSG